MDDGNDDERFSFMTTNPLDKVEEKIADVRDNTLTLNLFMATAIFLIWAMGKLVVIDDTLTFILIFIVIVFCHFFHSVMD